MDQLSKGQRATALLLLLHMGLEVTYSDDRASRKKATETDPDGHLRVVRRIPAKIATSDSAEVAMGRSRATHAGCGMKEKQDRFARLIAQGASNSDTTRTGTPPDRI